MEKKAMTRILFLSLITGLLLALIETTMTGKPPHTILATTIGQVIGFLYIKKQDKGVEKFQKVFLGLFAGLFGAYLAMEIFYIFIA